jgi:quercetin dioxygenase-like cupin family protein
VVLTQTGILPQWPFGKDRFGGEPEGSASMGAIRYVRLDRSQGVPSTNPIFVGSVSTQEVVNEELADLLRVTAVTFADGAVNRPHRHTTDQVLVATSGSGFVATDDDHHPLEPGDVAFVPAGTRHWHGARADSTFTHLAIMTPGHTEIDDVGPA